MVRIGGTSQFIRLRDLSPEGARLDGVTGLSVGSEGTLCLSLIGPNAAFQVRNVYPDGSCGVLFVQDRVAHDFADAVTGITQAVAEAA